MRGKVNIWIKVKKAKYYQNGYRKTDCISKKSKSLKFRRLKSRGFKVSPRDRTESLANDDFSAQNAGNIK